MTLLTRLRTILQQRHRTKRSVSHRGQAHGTPLQLLDC